jgi:hypothetical protein
MTGPQPYRVTITLVVDAYSEGDALTVVRDDYLTDPDAVLAGAEVALLDARESFQ